MTAPDLVPRAPARGAVLRLAVLAVGVEACLALVGGVAGAGVGAVFLAAAGIWTAHYVGSADVLDNDYRKSAALARAREPSLLNWAGAIEAAGESVTGYEQVLRPQLERLYAVRLAERHGVSLYHEPERAAALIGPQVWPLIDPRRPARTEQSPRPRLDRWAQSAQRPGPLSEAALRDLIDRLETL